MHKTHNLTLTIKYAGMKETLFYLQFQDSVNSIQSKSSFFYLWVRTLISTQTNTSLKASIGRCCVI